MSMALEHRLRRILSSEKDFIEHLDGMVHLMTLFARLPVPPDPVGIFPDYDRLKHEFISSIDDGDPDLVEESFLNLYCHVHGHEAPYTAQERRRVDETGGYWCHAGGISPLLRAADHIGPDTVSGDFGAGNGLQGLLFQKLYPHRLAIQIEISSRMVEAGRHLQSWLDIPSGRVKWIVGDVLDASAKGMDFIYMYRPVRPDGEGGEFYRKFAKELSGTGNAVVIFSIADCLRHYLGEEFKVFYSDGHLTCFRRK